LNQNFPYIKNMYFFFIVIAFVGEK